MPVMTDRSGSGWHWRSHSSGRCPVGSWVQSTWPSTRGEFESTFLDQFLIEMSAIERPVVVVVEDLHFLRDPAILADLASVVEHLPTRVRLVFTTRVDPPLPVARWRARSWLVEVRQRELAFTLAEAALLFAALDEQRLGASDLESLWRRTEGWAGGLRLAAIAIRDHPDVSVAASEFSGRHHMVADLLVSEILDRQSDEISEFLLRTSIAEVLDADLCDALSGRYDSSVILRGLEADMAFLTTANADRTVYRYHPLLAELIRAELETRRPGTAPSVASGGSRRARDPRRQPGCGQPPAGRRRDRPGVIACHRHRLRPIRSRRHERRGGLGCAVPARNWQPVRCSGC